MATPNSPLYRRILWSILALCVVLAPLCAAGWFALCPQYGDPACPNNTQPLAVFVAFRAAPPVLLRLFLILTLIVPYIYPVSYVALGLLAMPRSPWLSILGLLCGWAGSIPWGFIGDAMFQINTATHLGQDTTYSVLSKAYFANPGILAVAGGWVLGHLLAYVLLGIALLRARAVPAWAAWAIILSAPLMGPLAYGSHIGWLQVAGYGLVFVGSLPAAWAMWRQTGPAPAAA